MVGWTGLKAQIAQLARLAWLDGPDVDPRPGGPTLLARWPAMLARLPRQSGPAGSPLPRIVLASPCFASPRNRSTRHRLGYVSAAHEPRLTLTLLDLASASPRFHLGPAAPRPYLASPRYGTASPRHGHDLASASPRMPMRGLEWPGLDCPGLTSAFLRTSLHFDSGSTRPRLGLDAASTRPSLDLATVSPRPRPVHASASNLASPPPFAKASPRIASASHRPRLRLDLGLPSSRVASAKPRLGIASASPRTRLDIT